MSYLKDRSQGIVENNIKSRSFTLKHGVPQGSPMSFLIYISFIFKLTINFKTTLCGYADNNQAYISFPSTPDGLNNAFQDIERCVKIIKQFLLTNNLLLNDSKTKNILIVNKKLLKKVDISLKMRTT